MEGNPDDFHELTTADIEAMNRAWHITLGNVVPEVEPVSPPPKGKRAVGRVVIRAARNE